MKEEKHYVIDLGNSCYEEYGSRTGAEIGIEDLVINKNVNVNDILVIQGRVLDFKISRAMITS